MRPENLLTLTKPYRKLLAAGVVAALCESAVDLLGPWPVKVVFDHVLGSRPVPGWLLGFTGPDKLGILQFAAWATLVIAALSALFSYMQKHATTTVGQWVTHDLRKTLYFHIQRLSLSYYDRQQTGDLVSRVTGDIDSIQSFVTSGLLNSAVQVLTLGGMVGVMLYMNWKFTLIALSVAPVLFAVVFRYTRLIKQSSREVRKKESQIVSIVQEVITSMRVVKAFAREDYEQRRMEEESLETVEAALRARSLKARLTPFVEIIVAAGTGLVLWYGARMVIREEMSAGSLLVFLAYLSKMYKPMQELSKMTDTYSKAAVGYERIREILKTDSDVKDRRGARKPPRLRGAIEFDDVTFAYDDKPVLQHLSFKVEPGQAVALVGKTGAGKSTILGLIPRFYDPDSGIVRIDGNDIRTFKQRALRDQISLVLQESVLFHGPIWQNIAYGKPEASRVEILKAAELANVDEFVKALPERYDTIVGERGITLSGGQRQRIAIARAIIRDTPILLLDEPSSGLDASSEKLVFEALDRLMQGRTSVVVAHRLSTIRNADVIFVIDGGRIIETGRHDELVKQGGSYAEFCEIQFGAFAETSPTA